MKNLITALVLIAATAGTAQAKSTWQYMESESLASGKTSSIAISNGNKSVFVQHIDQPGKRPADKGDIWEYHVSVFNGDSFICSNRNQISIYYKIDNQTVGYVQGWVPAGNKMARFTSVYASEANLTERPHYTKYQETLGSSEYTKVSFHMNAFIEDLKSGKELTIQTIDSCNESVTFTVPLTGFNESLNKLVK